MSVHTKPLRYSTRFSTNHTVVSSTKHKPYLPLQSHCRIGTHCIYHHRDGQAELTRLAVYKLR